MGPSKKEISVILTYHPSVLHEDLPEINQKIQRRILAAIEHRLLNGDPLHGKPLRHSYFNLRRLRVGDYRIIYNIAAKDTLHILMIKHRSSVYAELGRRIK